MKMPTRTWKTSILALPLAALAAVLSLAGAPAARAEDKPLALGASAPMADTKLKSAADGKDVTLAGAKGPKGLLVVFTSNLCPYAKAWEERLVELGNTYSKKGIGVVVVNSNDSASKPGESVEAMAARAKERKMAFPYASDATSGLARAFGATKTPEAFLFDKGGKLVYHGAIDDNHEEPAQVTKRYLKDALEATLTGKTPAVQETKSIGCGIKFRKVS
jgi:peroxiredoxin